MDTLSSSSHIEMRITGFRNGKGRVAVSIFRRENARDFPAGEKAIATQLVDLNGEREVTVSTASLPAGDYAIAVFHDEKSNGHFETNFLGIPKEGFGFSNNPLILFGPPSFQKSSFPLADDVAHVDIRLKYFL